MRSKEVRTPSEWFQAAADCYVQRHQGCPSCGRQHCVFQNRWGPRSEYHCSACGFSVCHDLESGKHFASPGDGRQLAESLLGHLALWEDENSANY
jgi:hypothetical protein